MRITKAYFTKRVGRPPERDDLERCNCRKAGQIGHEYCGWDREIDWPKCVSKLDMPQEAE